MTAAAQTGVEQTWVGRPLERFEDEALLRGAGRFLDDLDPEPRAHHAAVLRSTCAHARIVRLDASSALDMPGVTGVLTGADVVELSKPFPAACPTDVPCYAAAGDVARYAGEPLAVVVARDRYLAEDARDAIDVELEPLEPVLDPRAAAPVSDRHFSYGEPDAAFAAADVVVRERFAFPRWSGAPMECGCVVARWDPGEPSLTAWANFQGPFTLHSVAAAALGLPGAGLRLITPPDSGGSFGVKAGLFAYVVLMGLASRKLGVPVRWVEDRMEALAAGGSATGRTTEIEAAFSADGELLGLRIDAIEDVGAYVRAPEPATLYRMHGALTGAYRVQHLAVRNRVVLTNRAPTGLNRGFGGPQHYLPLEGIMAAAAQRLELDPAELARRNLIRAEEFPYTTPSGGLYGSGDYHACLDDALALLDYDGWRARRDAARAEGRLVGIGLACVVEPSISNMGYVTLVEPAEARAGSLPKSGNAEGATVAINPIGGVSVRLSTTPQGQGHATVAAQVVADVLGVDPGEVKVLSELDTAASAWTVASGNYSSRFSGVGAGAVLKAAEALAAKLRRIAAAQLDCDPDDVDLRELSLRRLAGSAHWNPDGLPDGVEPGLHATAYCPAAHLPPPDEDDRLPASGENGFVVDVAVVEVDRDSGRLTILDYATVHDAGRLLNPRLAEGQVLGGFAHGMGAALQERLAYGPDVEGVPAVDADGHPGTPARAPRDALVLYAARCQGPRGGHHDERAVRAAQRGARRARPAGRAAAHARPAVGGDAVKPAPFAYRRAESVEHALELLGAGDARVLAGGQSLVPLMNMRRVRPAALVDITRVDGLAAVSDPLEVGALVTQADFEAYAGRCRAVAECLPFTGHLATRNRGTVGGSIAHADPRGELPLVLLTLGGTATVASRRGRRTIAAEDLFAGAYRTTLAPDELLLTMTWPTTPAQAFEEVAQRHGDYTLAAAACALDGSGARIGVAAVADRPRMCPAAAAALADGGSPEDAGRIAAEEIAPIEDLHASAAYRRHLIAVLVERVVRRAWSRSS